MEEETEQGVNEVEQGRERVIMEMEEMEEETRENEETLFHQEYPESMLQYVLEDGSTRWAWGLAALAALILMAVAALSVVYCLRLLSSWVPIALAAVLSFVRVGVLCCLLWWSRQDAPPADQDSDADGQA